jgi:hypothetical protein
MPIKTLEGRLANPTTNKHQKLRETQTEYRRALDEAFRQGCETQSATNDVVVQYDLSGYAKNALKKYVPQLTGDSYDADELTDEHPVKFTDNGFDIDHKPQNAYEWYLKVPHDEDYNLWVPAGINPEQRPLVEALYAGDAELGEFRLVEEDDGWSLHITVHFDVADIGRVQRGAEVDNQQPPVRRSLSPRVFRNTDPAQTATVARLARRTVTCFTSSRPVTHGLSAASTETGNPGISGESDRLPPVSGLTLGSGGRRRPGHSLSRRSPCKESTVLVLRPLSGSAQSPARVSGAARS